jgi:recombination DNA repair RAD52 pathway protein
MFNFYSKKQNLQNLLRKYFYNDYRYGIIQNINKYIEKWKIESLDIGIFTSTTDPTLHLSTTVDSFVT